jgi:uncharacterized membrane protein YdjX (TVP38/TMEM64 family)
MTETEQAIAARRLSRARLAVLVAVPTAVVVLVAAGITDYLNLESLNAHRAELLAFVAARPVTAVLLFAAVYFAGIAVSIPGWGLLTVAAGFLFGPALGSVIVVISATAGAMVVFLAARYVLGDMLRGWAAPAIRKLETGFQENAFSYLLALRLTPVLPFFVTTLAVSFLGLKARTFFVATLLGVIPVTIVYTTLGAGLGDAMEVGVQDPLAAARQPTVIGGLLGLAVLVLLPVALKRWRRRQAGRATKSV